MNVPRLPRALSLDFPDVPDDAPAAVKPPRVWARPAFVAGKLCPCAACKDAEARLDARSLEFAPGSLPALRGYR